MKLIDALEDLLECSSYYDGDDEYLKARVALRALIVSGNLDAVLQLESER